MHISRRILLLLLLLAPLLPAGTAALVSIIQREETREELQSAIGDAGNRYRQRSGIGKSVEALEEQAEKLGKEAAEMARRKRVLRKNMGKIKTSLLPIERKYGEVVWDASLLQSLLKIQKQQLSSSLRTQYRSHFSMRSVFPWLSPVKAQPLPPAVQVHMTFIEDLTQAAILVAEWNTLATEREQLLGAYREVSAQQDKTVLAYERKKEEVEEIRRITLDVHEQVLKIQGELARIEAKLKRRAERELIEKGLIDHALGGHGTPSSPDFHWPAYGRISAGFHDDGYEDYFGVPHDGLDIVVGQETPVASAADGVVFLVRDGGAKGYTYVLVGHRGGYATLYGHLRRVSVEAGQEIGAGEIIGLSGGEPGSPGAGPMTTGAHLHFEVIQGGVNVDPKGVLP